MDFALIQGWIDVMGGHRCKGIKGVSHGVRLGRERLLRSRLIDWEEITVRAGRMDKFEEQIRPE